MSRFSNLINSNPVPSQESVIEVDNSKEKSTQKKGKRKVKK